MLSRKPEIHFSNPEQMSLLLNDLSRLLVLFLLTSGIAACHHNTIDEPPAPAKTETAVDTATANASSGTTLVIHPANSTQGEELITRARFNNPELENFLARNRKADYVFSLGEQKLFLVYTGSDNLYQFITGSPEPLKKYHPIPASIKQHILLLEQDSKKIAVLTQAEPTPVIYANIESTLSDKNPQPYLDDEVLKNLSLAKSGLGGYTPIYPKLFYLDKPLREVVENDYSFKYDREKHKLRLILPKAYEGGTVYVDKALDTRKIYLTRNFSTGYEQVLVVPDFFPGTDDYQSTRGKTRKAFGSLYDIDLTNPDIKPENLRIRYELKLCQKDNVAYCANQHGKNTYIRAAVISSVIYDAKSLDVIDSYILK